MVIEIVDDGDSGGVNTSGKTLRISEHALREALLTTLVDGNPFSTIEWEFSSGFDDINQQNREDFCGLVIAEVKKRAHFEYLLVESERRVVEAALTAHWEVGKSWLSKDSRLVQELANATGALLAARAHKSPPPANTNP